MTSAGGTTSAGGRAGSGGGGGLGVAGSITVCSVPSGSSCDTASPYCASYGYLSGDYVTSNCQNTGSGCVHGNKTLFECVDSCGSEVPGTGSDESHWAFKANCGG